jgi:hypothetical protein
MGNFFLMFWNANDAATALRTTFQLSSAADVSRLGWPWGSHIWRQED